MALMACKGVGAPLAEATAPPYAEETLLNATSSRYNRPVPSPPPPAPCRASGANQQIYEGDMQCFGFCYNE